jgi:VTC domain-containing protein
MASISTAWDPAAAPRLAEYGLLTPGRAELKYCLPGAISEGALDTARRYLPPDALASGPRQRVTSLYLDTAQLTFLQWHRERAADRFKLRIRRYGEEPAPMLYAEVKRKTGSIVRKRRAAFPAEALRAVLNGPDLSDIASAPDVSDELKEFVRRRSESDAMPRVLVTCIRESLRDPEDGTAVTVDRELRYQQTYRADLGGHAHAWQPMSLPNAFAGASVVMEMKYAMEPPAWMETLIVRLAPWRVPFSKYVAAMNQSAPPGTC